jgi:hypothetical protein
MDRKLVNSEACEKRYGGKVNGKKEQGNHLELTSDDAHFISFYGRM